MTFSTSAPTRRHRRAGRRGNHEGGIYQRQSDGRWCASVSLEGGKRRVIYGKTREEVAAKLTVALNTVRQGQNLPSHRLTLGAFLDQWLADVVQQRNRPSTAQSYEFYVRKYIIPGLGRHQLTKLTPQQVQRFLNERHAAGLALRTVQYIRAILRRALNQALRWELVSRNVATLADPPSGRSPEMRPLTTDDARALLAAARGHRHEHLLAFLLGTGLRIGEALALRWSDVDLDQGVITVRHALERLRSRPWRLAVPKSESGKRLVPSSAPPLRPSAPSAPAPSSCASPPAPPGKTSTSSSPPPSARPTTRATSTTTSRSSSARPACPPRTASTTCATPPRPTS